MRLGQLARRLNIKMDIIVGYLKDEKDVEIGLHPNTKIPDDQVDNVINEFKPQPIQAMTEALAEEDNIPETEKETQEEVIDHEVIENQEPIENIQLKVEANKSEEFSIEDDENKIKEADLHIVDGVIKAPKQDVEGIKVIGKIDLPDPPKQEEISEEEVSQNVDNEIVEKIKQAPKKKKNNKEEILQKKKKREEEKAQKEKQATEKRKLELEKKKRKEHYLQQVNIQGNSKKKATPKKKGKVSKKPKVKKDKPKGIWKKFLYWLNDKN